MRLGKREVALVRRVCSVSWFPCAALGRAVVLRLTLVAMIKCGYAPCESMHGCYAAAMRFGAALKETEIAQARATLIHVAD